MSDQPSIPIPLTPERRLTRVVAIKVPKLWSPAQRSCGVNRQLLTQIVPFWPRLPGQLSRSATRGTAIVRDLSLKFLAEWSVNRYTFAPVRFFRSSFSEQGGE